MNAVGPVERRSERETDPAEVRNRLEHELRAIWYELWALSHEVQQLAWRTESHDPATDQHVLRVLKEVESRLAGLRLSDATRDAMTCASLSATLGSRAA